MGYRVGWFALEGAQVESVAKELGYAVGSPMEGYPETAAVGQTADWTIIFDRSLLVSEDVLRELSTRQSVVAHEANDTVMYTRTSRWEDGELSWTASLDPLVNNDDDVVTTQGLSSADTEALRQAYDDGRAYGDVAEMAASIFGFRHDRPFPSDLQFFELIDVRPKPESITDQTTQWLLEQGFEAKDPNADRKKDQLFRRHVNGEFWIVAQVPNCLLYTSDAADE